MSTTSAHSAVIPTAIDPTGQILSMHGSRSQSIARSPHSMREELIAAQARSVGFGLRHDAVVAPVETVDPARSRLVQLARPILDSVFEDLLGTRIGLLLADENAWIVDRRVDESLRPRLDGVGLKPGHGWNERYVGTNGLGTALESAGPIVVRGDEHFAVALANLTSAAATIVDPGTGRPVGVVGLTCAVEDTDSLLLPFACRIVRDIERELIESASAAERTLLEHFVRIRRSTRGPIVAVNKRNMFFNAAAARFVSNADHALLWASADRAISERHVRSDELHLTNGTLVSVLCEPIRFASESVGALVRLVVGAPVVTPGRPRERPPSRLGWAGLSAGQLGIAELVAAGLTNQEAAARLYVSRHTVDFHLRQIFSKLGISSRVELARMVAEKRTDHEDAA
jgi:DNA-binding CsgD family transcriptional regulator